MDDFSDDEQPRRPKKIQKRVKSRKTAKSITTKDQELDFFDLGSSEKTLEDLNPLSFENEVDEPIPPIVQVVSEEVTTQIVENVPEKNDSDIEVICINRKRSLTPPPDTLSHLPVPHHQSLYFNSDIQADLPDFEIESSTHIPVNRNCIDAEIKLEVHYVMDSVAETQLKPLTFKVKMLNPLEVLFKYIAFVLETTTEEVVLEFMNVRIYPFATPSSSKIRILTLVKMTDGARLKCYRLSHYTKLQSIMNEDMKKQLVDTSIPVPFIETPTVDMITIKFRNVDKTVVEVKANKTDTIDAIIKRYIQKVGISDRVFKVFFDGESLEMDTTIEDNDIEDEDMLEIK
ncbi:hypothetical protein BC833DRAFT_575177 [Globomyces pollinis-pini]|nr:hypothetical protein BC833DRAFT_575177 [Globomyces pollinis-pini]